MKRLYKYAVPIITAVLIGLTVVDAFASGSPLEQIRGAVAKVLKVVGDHTLPAEIRKERIHLVMLENFDFEEVSKRVLGKHWQKGEVRARKHEFIPLFTELLEAAYLNLAQIAKVKKIAYQGEELDGEYASVHSTVFLTDKEITVVYRLYRKDNGWKIYDVTAMGVSLIGNYRSQFDRLLTNGSLDGLLKKMERKNIGN